jgi:SagB-type dehydrogenase family enzyme
MLGHLGHETGRSAGGAVTLPAPVPLQMRFSETVRRRRSQRTYTGESIPLAQLGTLASAGCGVTARRDLPDGGQVLLRSTASAGGLYPVDLQIASYRVQDLDRGVYLYHPASHELWLTGDGTAADRLLETMAAPEEVIMSSQAGALLLLIARPWRSMRKYGPRGMRHALLEAGAIAAHINLAAAALGLGSVDCSSLFDDEVHEALGVDGIYEAVVHAVVVGVSG